MVRRIYSFNEYFSAIHLVNAFMGHAHLDHDSRCLSSVVPTYWFKYCWVFTNLMKTHPSSAWPVSSSWCVLAQSLPCPREGEYMHLVHCGLSSPHITSTLPGWCQHFSAKFSTVWCASTPMGSLCHMSSSWPAHGLVGHVATNALGKPTLPQG